MIYKILLNKFTDFTRFSLVDYSTKQQVYY